MTGLFDVGLWVKHMFIIVHGTLISIKSHFIHKCNKNSKHQESYPSCMCYILWLNLKNLFEVIFLIFDATFLLRVDGELRMAFFIPHNC